MIYSTKTEIKKMDDPRVKRTRKLLEQAFIELLQEKDFQDITIQDISHRATVNRATFYAHFEDKYDLLDRFVHQAFNDILAEKVPLSTNTGIDRLQPIILTVIDFIVQIQRHCSISDMQIGPLIIFAIQEELMKYLLDWFALTPALRFPKGLKSQAAGRVWSWAIIGTAIQWVQVSQKVPASEIAQEITAVLTAGITSITG